MDLSCNELSEITLPENLPPKLQELDLTGNPRLNLDHKTLEQLKYVTLFILQRKLFLKLTSFVVFFSITIFDKVFIIHYLFAVFSKNILLSSVCEDEGWVLILFVYFFFFLSVTFAVSVLIHRQHSHRMRHLGGLLCGVMVTLRPQA